MIKLGVSSCLLGCNCKYDGSHSRDDFVNNKLSDYFEFVQFCPEANAFGTPRESIRLVDKEKIVVQGNKSKEDLTDRLLDVSEELSIEINEKKLRGFIFKAKSPSCGIERVKVYKENGMPTTPTIGIFAKTVMEKLPFLPIEDEKRLIDPWLRENFIIHIYAYDAFLEFKEQFTKMKDLVDFHSRFKFFLQSKHEMNYRTLGRIVANEQKESPKEVVAKYEKLFLETIKEKSDRGKVVNVCQHIQGFLKSHISKEEKEVLAETLREFKKGVVPLIAYLKPLEIYIQKYNINYIKNQFFLKPYPSDLGLRSDIRAYK